jgi:hypothetical protein
MRPQLPFFALLLGLILPAAEPVPPLLMIHAEGTSPIGEATVSITNPRQDVGLLITAVEFDGQLPEVRYFHHGIYGSIGKRGGNYEYNPLIQQLSIPVGSCFLLPGQSASWKRSLRILEGGCQATVAWMEIPKEKIAQSLWFEYPKGAKSFADSIFLPLSEANQPRYSNLAAARENMPNVVLEGNFPRQEATIHADCLIKNPWLKSDELKKFPKGSVEISLRPVSENVIVAPETVFFRKFDLDKKAYVVVESPISSPIVVDFLFLCSQSKERTVPCLLSKKHFGDIVEVKEPSRNMYYNPGVTEVPLSLFPKLLARLQERHLGLRIYCIDPNSLGKRLVLTIFETEPKKEAPANVREPSGTVLP